MKKISLKMVAMIAASFHPYGAVFFTIGHKNVQFIPEMEWIATFLWVFGVQQAKHLII